MGYIVIQKKDKNKMAAMVEDILYTAGDLMHCVEELKEDEYGDRYGERSYGDRYGNRGGMGMRDGGRYGNRGGYGNRDWDEDEMYEMGERRGRRRY